MSNIVLKLVINPLEEDTGVLDWTVKNLQLAL
jgi:hypothetical protein